MSASTKLSTAVKALCYLAESYPEPRSSSQISSKVGVNASKLRQLLSMLNKQNVVTSEKGMTGGFIMNKAPKDVDLQAIYCAIEDRKAFHLDVSKINDVGEDGIEKFNDYFANLFADVQVDIENKMRNINLQTVMDQLEMKSNFKR